MVLSMKIYYFRGSLKDLTFRGKGGFAKNQYRQWDCLKRGRLGQFADLSGAWQERGGGGVFEGGLIPQCTL